MLGAGAGPWELSRLHHGQQAGASAGTRFPERYLVGASYFDLKGTLGWALVSS